MENVKFSVDTSTGEETLLNTNFTQLYDNSAQLMIQIADNPTAMKLFWWLISHMDRRNALVVSQKTLAEVLECTDRTIRTAVADLKSKKVLTVLKSGSSNVYIINSNVAWKGEALDKKYAQFEATVYLSSSEQEPEYRTHLMGHAEKQKKASRPHKISAVVAAQIAFCFAESAYSIFQLVSINTQS